MKIGDRLDLHIIDINSEGRGVGKKEGITFFVDGAILGEDLEAEIVEKKRRFYLAKKTQTVNPSPDLQKSLCPYSHICDGCNFQEINYGRQIDFKKKRIINSINKMSGEELDDIDFIAADERYNYRNKIELKLSPRGELSYFSRKSNDHIAIESCLIADKKINDIMELLQEAIREYKLTGYSRQSKNGLIKNIIIKSTSLGESMVVFVYTRDGFKEKESFYNFLTASSLIDSIYESVNNRPNDYRIGRKAKKVYGRDKIRERVLGKDFFISPASFFQVNTAMTEKLYGRAHDYLMSTNPKKVIDLYSGTGTTSILMADKLDSIVSVEIMADAIRDAKENARLNGVDNIQWINAAAEDVIGKIDKDDENISVLFDPPRKGLDKGVINSIGKSSIRNLVYISCNPITLARDIKLFKDYGFELKKITGVDMFVNTLHVECVALLERQ